MAKTTRRRCHSCREGMRERSGGILLWDGGRRREPDLNAPPVERPSSRERPTTHTPVFFPPHLPVWEALNLPGTGLHLRRNSVFAQSGSCLIFFTEDQKEGVSVSSHAGISALSLQALCATPGELPAMAGRIRGVHAPSPAPMPPMHGGASSPHTDAQSTPKHMH